jgi:2,4-dienoyl-CoA reductase-like NADH-dependent reductase (Old Yellow Enzyme family)
MRILCNAKHGLPDAQFGVYLLERAKGSAAMIVTEPMPAHRTGVLTRGNFRNDTDDVIPQFFLMRTAVQKFATAVAG